MVIKKIKILQLLLISFFLFILIVGLLGAISIRQSAKIGNRVNFLYNHSLEVRRAIGDFKADVLSIHRNMKDLFLLSDPVELESNLLMMERWETDGHRQLKALEESYSGDIKDIEKVKSDFSHWNRLRNETIRLFRAGKYEIAAQRTLTKGVAGSQVEMLLASLDALSEFTREKADIESAYAMDLEQGLKNSMLLIVIVLMMFSGLMFYLIYNSVRLPLVGLARATQAFRRGDLSARFDYSGTNEFSEFALVYNELADHLERKLFSDELSSKLSRKMLETDVPARFFQDTLTFLASGSEANMAAIYVRTEDESAFECAASIGLDDEMRITFPANEFEGHFGISMATRQIHHIKSVPEDAFFKFHTLNGSFIPKEIITIPVIAGGDILACVSLVSIHPFKPVVIQWLNEIQSVLSARVAGVMAAQLMKRFYERVNLQNRTLESQQEELRSQAVELKRQNSELEFQKTQLNEANRLKSAFLSNMSHELRTPLNSVIALSGLLGRKLASSISKDEQEYLEVIERNGKRLLELINDILDISRIESGKVELITSRFDMLQLVQEVVTLVSPIADSKNLSLLFNRDPGTLMMTSDYEKCYHILQNLLGNAVKFTVHGEVEVSVTKSRHEVKILVKDTGPGIPDDDLNYIFDEFRQADETNSRQHEGSGLGLAIAKKYAELLGGKITVTSVVGKGSDFVLSLPFKTDEKDGEPLDFIPFQSHEGSVQSTDVVTSKDGKGKSILLVEDSEPAIIQVVDILEENGFEVHIAKNGEEALEQLSVLVPDAVILDLMMPGIDGFGVLRNIREMESVAHLPVLILTAKHITREELSFLTRNNIHQLIYKGDVNREKLLQAVKTMVYQ